MEDGELGGRAYAHVLALAQEPRGAVTDGERRAQEYAARTLGAVCDGGRATHGDRHPCADEF